MCTSHKDTVKLSKDDRRFMVFNSTPDDPVKPLTFNHPGPRHHGKTTFQHWFTCRENTIKEFMNENNLTPDQCQIISFQGNNEEWLSDKANKITPVLLPKLRFGS